MVYSANPSARPGLAERWKSPGFANIKAIDGPLDQVALPQDGSLDFVIIHLQSSRPCSGSAHRNEKRILAALKGGGIYGVVDHSAKDGTGNEAVKRCIASTKRWSFKK